MSIKAIQKRVKRVMVGTAMSGAMVFTPMSGCDLVAGGNPAVKGVMDSARIIGGQDYDYWESNFGEQNVSSRVFFNYHHFHN